MEKAPAIDDRRCQTREAGAASFYSSLSGEQKARFNRIGQQLSQSNGWQSQKRKRRPQRPPFYSCRDLFRRDANLRAAALTSA